MKHLIDLIDKAIEKINSTQSLIQVFSHLDCDGVAAASIMASVLMQSNKSFQITFANRINEELIETLRKRESELAIFTDLGSGYLDLIKDLNSDVIVLDHHQIEGSPAENVIHINPEEVDLKLSGSGITYLLAKVMTKNNYLAPLAIVGTIGDVSYETDSKLFENPLIEAEIGLNLFGRFSRPLYKALEFSDIPEINEESKAIQFLSEIGINPQENGEWRTLNNLSVEEKRKLTDGIVRESLNHEKFSKKLIFGDVLTLKNFPEELKDPKEFATILNATANMNEPSIGLAICLGNEKALGTARNLLKAYRKIIGNYMRWIENNPESIKQTETANYILGKDVINENFIGTIVSMLFRPVEKTLIGFGNSKDGIKISGRSKDSNIRNVIVEAARLCGGRGGGHESAAGAIIPADAQKKFIETCEKLLKEKLIKI
jgi:RecJ-like exonuclease